MTQWYEQRHAPPVGTSLGGADEILPGGVREFRFGGDTPFAFRLFVYNDNGIFRAYWNSCPHFDVPLNHTTEELISSDGQHFLCMTHYARFDKSSGQCFEGPCEGEFLQGIPLQVEDNQLSIGTNR